MKIQVKVKNVYGNDLVYPTCETGYKFAELLKVKSFNSQQINIIKKLGYVFDAATPVLA